MYHFLDFRLNILPSIPISDEERLRFGTSFHIVTKTKYLHILTWSKCTNINGFKASSASDDTNRCNCLPYRIVETIELWFDWNFKS